MALRLDITALISLVGEDKLREELNKNTWYIQFIDIRDINVNSITRFTTTSNPIEYLLFNDTDFFRYIAFRLPNIYDHDKFESEDDYSSWLYEQLDEEMKIPIDSAELLWKTINSYSHDQIINLFNEDGDEVYILYDKYFTPVLPYCYETNEFLAKWFPR